MKTGIGQLKYCNTRLFTLFDQSLQESFRQSFIFLLVLTDHDLSDPTLSQVDRTRFFAVVLYLNFV